MNQNNTTERVVIEGEDFKKPFVSNEKPTPQMVKLVMKLSGGAIKEQKKAEYILLGFAVVIIGISLYLFFGMQSNNKSRNSSDASVEKMRQEILLKIKN